MQRDAESPVFVKHRQSKAKELINLSHLPVSLNVQEIRLCGTHLRGIFKVFQYFQNLKFTYFEDNKREIAEIVTKEGPGYKAAR